MTLDAALPSSLKAILDDIRRRLANLERSPRLTSASIRGGNLRVLDDSGRVAVELGTQTGGAGVRFFRPDGTEAFRVYSGTASGDSGQGNVLSYAGIIDKDGRVVVSDDAYAGGLALPWVPATAAPLAPTGTYGFIYQEPTETGTKLAYQLRFLQQHPRLLIDALGWAEPGTSARIDVVAADDGDKVLRTVTVTGETAQVGAVISAATLDTSRLQTFRSLYVKITRTAGSGRCAVRVDHVVGIQS